MLQMMHVQGDMLSLLCEWWFCNVLNACMTVECGMRCGCSCCNRIITLAVVLCLRCRLCWAVSFLVVFVLAMKSSGGLQQWNEVGVYGEQYVRIKKCKGKKG